MKVMTLLFCSGLALDAFAADDVLAKLKMVECFSAFEGVDTQRVNSEWLTDSSGDLQLRLKIDRFIGSDVYKQNFAISEAIIDGDELRIAGKNVKGTTGILVISKDPSEADFAKFGFSEIKVGRKVQNYLNLQCRAEFN